MRKNVIQTVLCVTVLLLAAALSEELRPLLPNTFLAGCACAAATSMALLLCMSMMHIHNLDKLQGQTLDLVKKILDTTDRVAEDNEKITKKVNEMIERYTVLYDMKPYNLPTEEQEDGRQEDDQD